MKPSERLDEFIDAYDAELGAIRRYGAKRRIDLNQGKVTQTGRTNSIVTFTNSDSVPIDEGATGTLVTAQSSHPVTVIAVSHEAVALHVDKPLTRIADTATLEFAPGMLCSAIIKRLKSIRDTGAEAFFSLADGDRIIDSSQGTPNASLVEPDPALNTRQNAAVSTMLGAGTSFIWGPPGTGKTSTVAEAVRHFVRRGQSVLLVSTTNAAVDVLTLRIAHLLATDGVLPAGLIVRDGYPTEVVRDAYDGVLTPDAALTALGHDERDLLRKVEVAIEQATRQQQRLHRLGDEYLSDVQQWRDRLVQLTDAQVRLADMADDVDSGLITDATVIASTAHRVATGRVPRRFDAVVIDEASMISLPLAWLAAGQARSHIVVAGDFRQLGPISQADPTEATAVLRRSAFEESGIATTPHSTAHPSLVALTEQYRMVKPINDLVGHHFYPDSPLYVSAYVTERTQNAPWPTLPHIVRINLSGHRMWASRSRGVRSRYNLANAQVVFAMAHLAARSGSPMTTELIATISPYRAQASILDAALAEVAAGRGSVNAGSLASTVHRFQGGEARGVILDLTDAHGTEVGKFFQGDGLDSDTSRMVNVAISRAQDQIIVIGDFTRVLNALPTRSPVGRALTEVRDHAHYLTVEHIAELVGDACVFDVIGKSPAEHVLEDIRTAERRVTIFSESIDRRLHSRLVSACGAALARGARVQIVTGPPGRRDSRHCQQELLNQHDELRAAGITVHMRENPNGYESAIVVDDVLWVGRNSGSDGLLGSSASRTAFRTGSPALANEALLHMERRAPSGYRYDDGQDSANCRRCGRPMAFGDTFHQTYLYCPHCRAEQSSPAPVP